MLGFKNKYNRKISRICVYILNKKYNMHEKKYNIKKYFKTNITWTILLKLKASFSY